MRNLRKFESSLTRKNITDKQINKLIKIMINVKGTSESHLFVLFVTDNNIFLSARVSRLGVLALYISYHTQVIGYMLVN